MGNNGSEIRFICSSGCPSEHPEEHRAVRRTLTFNQHPTYLKLGVAFRLMR